MEKTTRDILPSISKKFTKSSNDYEDKCKPRDEAKNPGVSFIPERGVIPILFYDFEVFKYDWLVVVLDMMNKKEHVIVNDRDVLEALHEQHKGDIWVGFNSRHYDQYILKGVLCGLDPKKINDFIIVQGQPGWRFSTLFRKVHINNYDVMQNLDRGLKVFEGFMGSNIRESSVPFDIDRKLTQAEIEETIQYCRHDVEQTVEIFLRRKDDFEAHMGLAKIASGKDGLNLALLNKTKAQLSAIILEATRQDYDDEFNIDFPDTLRLNKYRAVLDWYKNPENRTYYKHNAKGTVVKNQLEVMVAGVPHVFGWGGLHGAREKYQGQGYYLNMDAASLYPSLMIRYNLHSRSMKHPEKFKEIYDRRLKYKAEKNPLQAPLKLVLNSTYGVMKDPNNDLYDPLQANRVCVYGQLLLLDLIELLEPHCTLIQSNTDGILIKLNEYEDFDLIDDLCWEWEQRTGMTLEFDEYRRVYQKDVNNYIIVDANGNYKSKGAYVKQLNPLDYDLPILNRALVQYMVHDIPIEQTIHSCDQLMEFQLVTKISGKYSHIQHGDRVLKEKTIRVFASKDPKDPGVQKWSIRTGRPEKITNSPLHCFINNGDITGTKVPDKLDKKWYINFAKKRLKDFGVM